MWGPFHAGTSGAGRALWSGGERSAGPVRPVGSSEGSPVVRFGVPGGGGGVCLSPATYVVWLPGSWPCLSAPVTRCLLQRRNFTLAFQAAESVGIKSTLVSPPLP